MRGHGSSREKVPPHPVILGEVVRLPTVGQDVYKEFSAFRKFVKMKPLVGWKVASGIGPNLFQALFFYLMNLTF